MSTPRWKCSSRVAALAVVAIGVVACDIGPVGPEAGAGAGPQAMQEEVSPTLSEAPILLVAGLQGASGSAVGPGGQLYVTEGAVGRISRVDPKTGSVTTFASGLPPWLIGFGGATDVAFIGGTAYVLVTLVDDPLLFPTGQINGIYRVDGPNEFTVIADIGAYNVDHPPEGFDFFVQTGVLYALEAYRGGFLVTDGHLNRVLHVTLDGEITEFMAFDNVVPTGLEVWGNTVYMTEAGPVPHVAADGKVVAASPGSADVWTVASGSPLLVDVERGRGHALFALSQGTFGGGDPGAPALPNTGALVRVQPDGALMTVEEGLNLPTSLELIGSRAYIVSLAGEIWTIDNVDGDAPYGP